MSNYKTFITVLFLTTVNKYKSYISILLYVLHTGVLNSNSRRGKLYILHTH